MKKREKIGLAASVGRQAKKKPGNSDGRNEQEIEKRAGFQVKGRA